MRKRTAGGKNIPLAVIILAFFHWFSYHYGALSQKRKTPTWVSFFFGAALLLRKSGRLRAGD